MTQVKIQKTDNIQQEMVKILSSDTARGEVVFGFVQTTEGIEPLIIVADTVPQRDKVADILYNLFDSLYDFKKIKEESLK